MKRSWMLFFLIPIFTSAAYPIYDDDVAVQLPELLTREPHSSKDVAKEKQSEKTSAHYSAEKSASSSEDKKQFAISKRDPIKRNSAIQSTTPRSKLRQNPNRPRVIQREEQKQPQDLSKIEADAEEIENGLSTHQNKERGNKGKSPSDSATAQEIEDMD